MLSTTRLAAVESSAAELISERAARVACEARLVAVEASVAAVSRDFASTAASASRLAAVEARLSAFEQRLPADVEPSFRADRAHNRRSVLRFLSRRLHNFVLLRFQPRRALNLFWILGRVAQALGRCDWQASTHDERPNRLHQMLCIQCRRCDGALW